MQLTLVFVATIAIVTAQKTQTLMRSEVSEGSDPSYPQVTESVVQVEEHSHEDKSKWHDDPCPTVGCNGYKCAWVTGEVVSKVMTKRSCSNARALGNLKGEVANKKIETLTQCVREVKRQLLASEEELKSMSNGTEAVLPCSPFFEVHMETYNCACVPHGSDCTEHEDRGVCRLKLVEY
mmetsp:Transcript_125701/g.217692  ORF Transcript_125701/g.217692 Transcript_125701/m.217692 type:complete len:179 (-) Transcript_125701:95-631(-)